MILAILRFMYVKERRNIHFFLILSIIHMIIVFEECFLFNLYANHITILIKINNRRKKIKNFGNLEILQFFFIISLILLLIKFRHVIFKLKIKNT